MNETKAALKEVAHQLKGLMVTVAVLEKLVVTGQVNSRDYLDMRSLVEQSSKEIDSRLQALIDAIPDTQ